MIDTTHCELEPKHQRKLRIITTTLLVASIPKKLTHFQRDFVRRHDVIVLGEGGREQVDGLLVRQVGEEVAAFQDLEILEPGFVSLRRILDVRQRLHLLMFLRPKPVVS